MYYLERLFKAAGLTADEYVILFKERRKAFDHVASITSLTGTIPACDRHGFKGQVDILGRDRDGSLIAQVRVRAPNLAGEYVRKLRLVPSERLPFS